MEEQVGALWHRAITHLAERRHPEAAVRLEEVAAGIGLFFRALGGDGGLQVEASEASAHGARRGLLQRLAGGDDKVELAWRDARSLRLPSLIDDFPERALNRDLYLWLAALAAHQTAPMTDWFTASQALTRQTLSRFPGLRPRYRRLLAAHLARRPDPRRLPADAREREEAIRRALSDPGSVARLPAARRPAHPVRLWLHPHPELPAGAWSSPDTATDDRERHGAVESLGARRRRRAERVAPPQRDQGLVTIRMENILTWGEHVQVDRGTDEEEDLERARAAAEDLDRIAVARDRKASGARLRFDLDLPAESEDDLVLSDGILVPEWDWRRGRLQPNHCRIVPLLAADARPRPLPEHLRRTATRLRHQFNALTPARMWLRGQNEGQDLDLDACLRFAAERHAGPGGRGDGLYRDARRGARDLACLLLADLSLSTDTWIDDRARVIDVIRDSLFLFAESLAATGDRFGLFGFSSRRRDPVRVHTLKDFDEPHGAAVRGRIDAIRPGYYTRMGAAIRYASGLLARQPGGRRLLLLLTDGKPNDLDRYEGRYGIEDTRQAVREARRLGLTCFCVTIDKDGNDYLPHLFGAGGYVVIRRPTELPSRLPLLYARLTASRP
ncbi:nitric oxide reductase activation protein NorD [Thiocystis violacea]|uniref:nitric oxide reductase activation protein NorD n=1 Tax=Thiocystis violacea TaxID=13725 RepID=UPI0019035953|nr:VWA domain-containing protein [Thiocystis violacea]MBK1717353.1 nitric oxide reductase [Thiocystis violacea]